MYFWLEEQSGSDPWFCTIYFKHEVVRMPIIYQVCFTRNFVFKADLTNCEFRLLDIFKWLHRYSRLGETNNVACVFGMLKKFSTGKIRKDLSRDNFVKQRDKLLHTFCRRRGKSLLRKFLSLELGQPMGCTSRCINIEDVSSDTIKERALNYC